MKKSLTSLSAATALTAFAAVAHGADYYVAPNGGASAAGTMAAPWTMAKATGSTGATGLAALLVLGLALLRRRRRHD